jgi:hypothetical protein
LGHVPLGRLLGDGAGFFSDVHGYLPWVWTEGGIDTFLIWEVLP